MNNVIIELNLNVGHISTDCHQKPIMRNSKKREKIEPWENTKWQSSGWVLVLRLVSWKCKFSKPNRDQSEAKPKQFQMPLDTQLKIFPKFSACLVSILTFQFIERIVLLPEMSTINEMVLITDLDPDQVKGKYPKLTAL